MSSGTAIKNAFRFINKHFLGGPNLRSNEPIRANIGMFNGIAATFRNMSKDGANMSFVDALKAAHTVPTEVIEDGVKKTVDKINWGTVAGSYLTTSAALRIASGGGLYKDSRGNTDVIGIPFV